MKKIIVVIDIFIFVFIVMIYLHCIYPGFYNEIYTEKVIEAFKIGDIEYLEKQFSHDAIICIIRGENEIRYRAEYIIGELGEQLPIHIVSIQYLPYENVYEVVYLEDERKRVVYVTYAVNQINPFQSKITGMSVEFIE
ncbi:MAG: hypothetical protein J6A80_06440 [Lachnospiraceae bacterium]|nr:hypothetical protein [Lachnospiraceae bacterium]